MDKYEFKQSPADKDCESALITIKVTAPDIYQVVNHFVYFLLACSFSKGLIMKAMKTVIQEFSDE